ncbi:hypothetical protein BCR33DRAFT_741503 [Rhizoclosmatium globosum]|uniref:Sfi1 spindle body domain-containing protein n=1 Tax=Rhizoclosmatium globosum TaxID=329046 RepID=A0A1Y2BX23_9FUNG|nr:hypothetical protein BCR33DRAFT_741503 [Rhizoclosmatium globosum]|eukprot:ORY38655.1 hypothetical protein BCR33DRAFT_741503 [Rhizoclosmatium globosum]
MYDTHHASLAQAAVSLVGKLPPSSKDGGPSSLLRLLRAVDALERNVAQTTETTRDFAALRSFFCAAANEGKLAHLDWAAKVDAAVLESILTAIRANCDLFNINWNAVVTFTGAPEENKENSLDPLLDSEFDAIQLAMNSRLDLIDSLSNVNHFNTSKGILTGSGVSFLNLNNTLKPNTTSNINLNSTLNISPIKPTHPKNLIPPVSVLAENEDIEVENENINEATHDSEEEIDLLQKAFTAWNLITRRSRHERNCMIHYWLLAVQVWKRNSLTHCFQKWISKDHSKKLARKRKAFQALYEHSTIPNEHALSFNRNRILSGALSKWFKNAYRKRSMKRKEEVAEDTAILVHDLNLQYRYLKVTFYIPYCEVLTHSQQKWRRKFAKQFLLKDGTDRMNELCSMNLKRRFWRLWKQRLRNVIKADKFHEKQLVEAFFVKWMHRKHLKKLDKRALNHRKYLDNDLKSVYFHVWREKR